MALASYLTPITKDLPGASRVTQFLINIIKATPENIKQAPGVALLQNLTLAEEHVVFLLSQRIERLVCCL